MKKESRSFVRQSTNVSLVILSLATVLTGATRPQAHVKYLQGESARAHRGQLDWSPVELNSVMLEGDRVILHLNSVLDLQFDDGSLMRLGPRSDLLFQKMAGSGIEIRLLLGEMILQSQTSGFRIVMASAVLYLKQGGFYKIGVTENGKTTVKVNEGLATTEYRGSSIDLGAGDAFVGGGHSRTGAPADLGTGSRFPSERDQVSADRVSGSVASENYPATYLGGYGEVAIGTSHVAFGWPQFSYLWSPYAFPYQPHRTFPVRSFHRRRALGSAPHFFPGCPTSSALFAYPHLPCPPRGFTRHSGRAVPRGVTSPHRSVRGPQTIASRTAWALKERPVEVTDTARRYRRGGFSSQPTTSRGVRRTRGVGSMRSYPLGGIRSPIGSTVSSFNRPGVPSSVGTTVLPRGQRILSPRAGGRNSGVTQPRRTAPRRLNSFRTRGSQSFDRSARGRTGARASRSRSSRR